MSRTSAFAKAGVVVLGLGLATAVGAAAFGGWTDTDVVTMDMQYGTVNLGLGASTLTTQFGTTASPLAPGDSGYRYLEVNNTGANAVTSNVTLWVSITDLTDATNDPATTADIAGDIKVTVDRCSVAWVQSSASCAGTQTQVLAATYLSGFDSAPEAISLLPAFAPSESAYLRLRLVVDSRTDITTATDGAALSLLWSLDAAPV